MVLCNICVEMGFHFDEIFFQHDLYNRRFGSSQSWASSEAGGESNDSGACEPATTPRQQGYRHHASYDCLIKSAALGCELCILFAFNGTEVYHVDSLRDGSSHREIDFDGISNAVLEAEAEAEDHEKQIVVVGKNSALGRSARDGFSEIRLFFCRKICLEVGVFCYPGQWHIGSPSRATKKIMAIVTDDGSYGGIISGRPLYSHRFKDVLSIMPANWINECLGYHSACPFGSSPLPTRLINVGAKSGTREPFILNTSPSSRGTWIALSHCWGGQIPQRTTTQNLASRQQSLPINGLPKTFHDAVMITRELGFQYLWIDSLCILQDSPSDWLREASNMKNVYKNAALTLAATAGQNSNSGILVERQENSDLYSIPLPYESLFFGMRGTMHFRRHSYSRAQGQLAPRGPLTTRAWTVQENVLSPRTLHFGKHEIVWECNTTFETESLPNPHFWDYSLENLSLQRDAVLDSDHRDLLARWYRIISEYGVRGLTVIEDKLLAISGVAQEIASHTQFAYRAGLWEEDLRFGLLWSFDGVGSMSSRYLAPSWSWASMGFGTHCPEELVNTPCGRPYYYANPAIIDTHHPEYDVEVIQCSVDLAGEDRYGRVSSGCLILRGKCLPATYHPTPYRSSADIPPNKFVRGCIADVFNLSGAQVPNGRIICSVDDDIHHIYQDRPRGKNPLMKI
jgi:Heterokaryon incompatibility protein (HET)